LPKDAWTWRHSTGKQHPRLGSRVTGHVTLSPSEGLTFVCLHRVISGSLSSEIDYVDCIVSI
jgi:hypothetical protein